MVRSVGRLAQPVQSACLTRRRSQVRILQRPLNLGESDSRCLFPLDRSRIGPAAVVEGLPEPTFVGSLTTLEHRLGSLPATELAEHPERLIHQVRGKLPPQRVPAPATFRL